MIQSLNFIFVSKAAFIPNFFMKYFFPSFWSTWKQVFKESLCHCLLFNFSTGLPIAPRTRNYCAQTFIEPDFFSLNFEEYIREPVKNVLAEFVR